MLSHSRGVSEEGKCLSFSYVIFQLFNATLSILASITNIIDLYKYHILLLSASLFDWFKLVCCSYVLYTEEK